jgi:hypothetical protein
MDICGGLGLPVEQPAAVKATPQVRSSVASHTTAMQGLGSRQVDVRPGPVTIWGVGDGAVTGYEMTRRSSRTFGNAYRANVGHETDFGGNSIRNLFILLARPRGIEPLFSP